ncbi:MAG: hypothetical protein KAH57_09555 [Thermoplasmata archaeon]|nr:hypothetical protein [Thermoplasmata archaeon]
MPEVLSDDNLKRKIYRPIIKVLDRSISSLKKLERDMPISKIAWMEVNGNFNDPRLSDFGKDIIDISNRLNIYRRAYWELEGNIKRSFVSYMKKNGYLPANSREFDSLKNSLPKAMIEGDERIWIYSYDHYISKISDAVGRSMDNAPKSSIIWSDISDRYSRKIQNIVGKANDILPDIYVLKAKVSRASRKPEVPWKNINIKKPKVQFIERPIRRFIMLKKPIPIEGTRRISLRRVLRRITKKR